MSDTIKVRYRDKTFEYSGHISASELLTEMGINRESVLVTKNGEVITEDEILKPGDEVLIINVISGG